MMNERRTFRPRGASPWLWVELIWLSVGMFDASDTVFSMRAEGHHHAWFNLFITLLLPGCRGRWRVRSSSAWDAAMLRG